jgi:hypothetical protein
MLTIALCCMGMEAWAYRLRINGLVTDYGTQQPLASARIRVYKNGVLQKRLASNSGGRYAFVFDNHSKYVVRVDAPGYQGKCIIIDTHGLEWERDPRVSDLDLEMRLPAYRNDVDLSFLDLPLGLASFEPATGHTSWSRGDERNIMADNVDLMQRYDRLVGDRLLPVASRHRAGDGLAAIRL